MFMKLATFQEELGSSILRVKNSEAVSPREFVRKVHPSKFINEASHLAEGALF